MKTSFQNINISFKLDGVSIDILNIISERFIRTIPAHSHGSSCYEIHYIPYGFGRLIANGNSYNITPNTLYVTGPHIEHAQFPDSGNPMFEYCVYLRFQKLPQGKKLSPLVKSFTAANFWFGKDSQDIDSTMKQIFSELESKYIGYQTQVEALLIALLIKLVRNYKQYKLTNEQTGSNTPFDNKARVIEDYFLYESDSLSLTTLSERLSLSTRQTERLLREYYNKSFQEKKAEARMSAAAILLENNNLSISKIAETLGFSSPEHFSTSFRKYYGTSPSEFRKKPDTH